MHLFQKIVQYNIPEAEVVEEVVAGVEVVAVVDHSTTHQIQKNYPEQKAHAPPRRLSMS
jgi:hypothetical protein